MTHETFPFEKMVSGMLDPGIIEETARIVNEAGKEKVQVKNRAGADRISSRRGRTCVTI